MVCILTVIWLFYNVEDSTSITATIPANQPKGGYHIIVTNPDGEIGILYNGFETVLVDQSINGGQWVSVGIYEFADDDTENITLSDNADSWIVADAVRFVRY